MCSLDLRIRAFERGVLVGWVKAEQLLLQRPRPRPIGELHQAAGARIDQRIAAVIAEGNDAGFELADRQIRDRGNVFETKLLRVRSRRKTRDGYQGKNEPHREFQCSDRPSVSERISCIDDG
jgi:hypothetical protein